MHAGDLCRGAREGCPAARTAGAGDDLAGVSFAAFRRPRPQPRDPPVKNAPVRHRVEYALYRGLVAALRPLSLAGARRLGARVGALGERLDARHRAVARRNLAIAFPEKSDAERERLVDACYRHFGAALCETIAAGDLPAEVLLARSRREGWEHLAAADARGRGTVVLSAHLGVWEVVPPVVALTVGPMAIVVRPADNPFLDRELVRIRERFGNRVIAKHGAARPMLQTLKEGGRLGLLIDQRVQPQEGIAVPFFGREALTTPVLARLSIRTGAAVVPIAAYPEPGGYRMVARPPILPDDFAVGGDDAVAALTRRYLEVAEEDIRQHPEQWLWMHRRWG